MENARIALFEDKPDVREEIRVILEGGGHEIVATATTSEEAEALANELRCADSGVHVLLLDGNLSGISPGYGRDVLRVFDILSVFLRNYKTIGISNTPMTEYGVPVTADVGKDGLKRLVEVINTF